MPVKGAMTVEVEAPADSPSVAADTLPASVTIDRFDQELTQLARLEAIQRDDAAMRGVLLALKIQGYSAKSLADLFAMDVTRVRRILRQARADGALNDVTQDLLTDALPLAVEKLVDALEKGETWAIQDTLKGLGAFKTHTAGDHGGGAAQTNLEVTFVMPDRPVVVDAKAMVGVPRETRHALPVGRTASVGAYPEGDEGARREGEGQGVGPIVEGAGSP